MITRSNPIGIEATGQVQLDPMELELEIKDLHGRIQGAERDRSEWLNKQRKLLELRRGRVNQQKSVPWTGANNHHWPLIDGVIRRWKPGIISLILDADPICYFLARRPEQVGSKETAQSFWHYKVHQLHDLTRKVHRLVDYVGQMGLAYTIEYWDYLTERSCRVVSVFELFPGGPQQAYAQLKEQVQQAQAQYQLAVDQGQVDPQDPNAQPPSIPSIEDFVHDAIQSQYALGQEEEDQLQAAVQNILGGAQYVKLYYRTIVRDQPGWDPMPAEDVVVPTRTTDVEMADWVAMVYRMSPNDIAVAVRDGQFLPEAAQEVLDRMARRQSTFEDAQAGFEIRSGGRHEMHQIEDRMDGVDEHGGRDEPGLEPIWRIFCHLDVDGDGIRERCVVWYHPGTATILSVSEYHFPFLEWPITPYEFEHVDARPYQARGIAEYLRTFQIQTNRLHNARLDAIQVTLSPMFTVRGAVATLNRNISFRPGGTVAVTDPTDFQPVLTNTQGLFQLLQEENLTKSLAEQYIGVFDAGVTNLLNPAERRTATEVESVNASISSVFGADSALFQAAFAKSMRKLWQLWLDFGPAEEYFRVTGEEAPRSVRKIEIAHDYDIVPAGTPANTSKALALSRAREALQLFINDQTGLINKEKLYRSYFDQTDRNLSKLIVRTEEEASAVQMVLQAAAQTQPEGAPPPAAY